MNEDKLIERWRKPVRPLAITEAPTVITTELGRETQEVKTRFRPEDIERFRTGYCCLRCWEPHETPWPERCAVCRYPIRKEQAAEFARLFKGEERDPRAVRIEEGLDRVDDTHERRFYETKSGIVIPRAI